MGIGRVPFSRHPKTSSVSSKAFHDFSTIFPRFVSRNMKNHHISRRMKNGDFELKIGAPGGTRTHDPLLRRQMLYPAELPEHTFGKPCRWNFAELQLKHRVPAKHKFGRASRTSRNFSSSTGFRRSISSGGRRRTQFPIIYHICGKNQSGGDAFRLFSVGVSNNGCDAFLNHVSRGRIKQWRGEERFFDVFRRRRNAVGIARRPGQKQQRIGRDRSPEAGAWGAVGKSAVRGLTFGGGRVY